VIHALARAVRPFADQDAGEADLAAGADADTDDDVLEALAKPFLEVDVSLEGLGDRGREVAAGELLCALVEGEVPVGDVDGLVRHGHIVTFTLFALVCV
jgi:hypothetical protein